MNCCTIVQTTAGRPTRADVRLASSILQPMTDHAIFRSNKNISHTYLQNEIAVNFIEALQWSSIILITNVSHTKYKRQ